MDRALSGYSRVNFLWSKRHIRSCLAIAWLIATQLAMQSAWGQLRALEPPAQSAQNSSPEAAQDPLGRSTPRGTVLGFFSAAYNQKYDVAAQYLNTRLRGKEAADLAQQLFVVLDRRLRAKLGTVSNEPAGSRSDPLDLRRELIGTVASAGGDIQIYVEHVDHPNAPQIWQFSSTTLASIPDLYDEVKGSQLEIVLPAWFQQKYLGMSAFAWLFFISLPVLYLILSLINRLLGAGLGYALRRWANRSSTKRPMILPPPLRLLIICICMRITITRVSLSLIVRQVASTLGIMILILAFVWIVIMIDGRVEAYIQKRMEKQGRLGSTAFLRPARRVVDLLAIVIGLMVALYSLGINPSATLAGLGVGGIAVALAAQKTLENVIGGASIIADDAVRVGDFLKLGDVVGTVETIGLRSTRVRTVDRTIVTIPNGQIATMTLENYSARDKFWLRHLIGLDHQTPSSKLNGIMFEVRTMLEKDPRIFSGSERVRFLRFAEYSLEMEVVAYIAAQDWNVFLEIQEELLFKIREHIVSAGAGIAFPARAVYLRNAMEDVGADTELSLHESAG
jgi:MscS family membrane protein